MIDFLGSITKGVQWPLLVFAIAGIYFRIKEKKWTSFDSCIWGTFILYELFAASQVWIFYGKLETSSRYLLIGILFYFPFAARGMIGIYNCLKRNRYALSAGMIALIIGIAINAYNIYSPTIKTYKPSKQQRKRLLTLRAAEVIKKDWNGAVTPPLMSFKCDFYQSGKRPLVDTEFTSIGYLAGGQAVTEFLKYVKCKPDYMVTSNGTCPRDYVLLQKIHYKDEVLFIYKRKQG